MAVPTFQKNVLDKSEDLYDKNAIKMLLNCMKTVK